MCSRWLVIVYLVAIRRMYPYTTVTPNRTANASTAAAVSWMK
jgi:hypothetical protein